MNLKEEMLELQKAVNEGAAEIPYIANWRHYSICALIAVHGVSLPIEHSLRWPRHSGDEIFPVPSCNPDMDSREAFIKIADKWSGEYGRARLELFNFLCDQTPWLHELDVEPWYELD